MAAPARKGAIKKSGSFQGQSNKLGYGGRAAQLKAKGVPAGVIGALAREAQAAPGQKNFHGGAGGAGGTKGKAAPFGGKQAPPFGKKGR